MWCECWMDRKRYVEILTHAKQDIVLGRPVRHTIVVERIHPGAFAAIFDSTFKFSGRAWNWLSTPSSFVMNYALKSILFASIE